MLSKKVLLVCFLAASQMLAQPLFAQEEIMNDNSSLQNATQETDENSSNSNSVFVLPELSIDAERATYQALISRPQDEIDSERMQSLPTHNPVTMIRSQNSSVTYGTGLAGATVTPRVRGLPSKYAAVTVDGVSINTPYWWNSPLSGFPLSRLKKITVSNTGSSMIYGQNTVAGAINFVLPSGKDYEGFTITQEFGGNGTKHQEYMYGYSDNKSEQLFAIFKDEYGGNRHFDNGAVDNNRNDNTMIYYKGSFDLSHDWRFEATFMDNDGTISCGDSWGDFERFEPWKMHLYSYKLIKNINDTDNFSLRYSDYLDYSKDIYYTDSSLKTVDNTKAHKQTEVKMKTIEALYNFKANNKNYINIGVQNQKAKDSHSDFSKDHQNKEFDSIRANDKLNIHLVARSDEDYEGERDTSYSINTNYDLNDKFSFGIAYSHTFQIPTLQDLYAGGKSNTYGNPDLKNEKSDNYELRLAYKINDKWNINLTGYKYEIEDMISTKTAAELGLTGSQWFRDRNGNPVVLANNSKVKTNINEAEISGYEFGVTGEINDKFNTWFSYTNFKKADDKSANRRLDSSPDYRLTFGIGYKYNKTTASLLVSHQSKTREIVTPGEVYKKLDDFTTADFYIREQIRRDFAIYLKVANIGNDKHIIMQQYAPSRSRPGVYYYEDGRVVTAGMELK